MHAKAHRKKTAKKRKPDGLTLLAADARSDASTTHPSALSLPPPGRRACAE